MIVIGTDTHKHTRTVSAVFAQTGQLAGELTASARKAGFSELLDWGRALDRERIWAIEDCRHVSGSFERFLVAAGERVVRVPPKMMGASRKGERTRGKSDPIDALAIARAALKEGPETLPGAHLDHEALELKLLLDHIARELLCVIRQRTRRAAELQREISVLVAAQSPELLELPGCGTLTAAKLLAETAGVQRFSSDAKLARMAGVAPIPASSGKRDRHRLDRGGNRQLNCALHRIAVTQGRVHPPARDYLARKQAEGKSRMEALRCLKRHLARTVWQALRSAQSRASNVPRSDLTNSPNSRPVARLALT
jgi:transposase